MAENGTPILDLSTVVNRPQIRIDGENYEILSPEELTAMDLQKFTRWGRDIAEMVARADQLDDDEQAALVGLLDQASDAIMVGVPVDIRAKLSIRHRMEIAQAFTQLQPTAAPNRRARRAAGKSAGAKRPRDARASTAATRGGGSTRSRSAS